MPRLRRMHRLIQKRADPLRDDRGVGEGEEVRTRHDFQHRAVDVRAVMAVRAVVAVDGAAVDHDLDAPIVGIAESMARDHRRALGPVGDQEARHQPQQVVDLGEAGGADHVAIDHGHRHRRVERRLRHARSNTGRLGWPPPPGTPIDDSIYILVIASILFGLYKTLKSTNTKKASK